MVENVERLFTVNLSGAYAHQRTKRAEWAVRELQQFIAKNSKVALTEVKLSIALNNKLWNGGITRPMRKVKVKVIKDGGLARVYLHDEKIEEKKPEEKKDGKTAVKSAEKPKAAEKAPEKDEKAKAPNVVPRAQDAKPEKPQRREVENL